MTNRSGPVLFCILLVAAALCPAGAAGAEESRQRTGKKLKDLKVVFGLNHLGFNRPGWLPVCVYFNVGDETFDGTIRLEFERKSERRRKPGLFVASRRMRFEAGKMQRVWLYAYADPEDVLMRVTINGPDFTITRHCPEFEIISGESRRSARFPGGHYRILVLGAEDDKKRPLLSTIDRQGTTGEASYRGYEESEFLVINPWLREHFHKSPKPLPDRVQGYNGIDMVVWNGYDIDSGLNERQKKALEMWVRRGGAFLISPDGISKLRKSRFINTLVKFEEPLDSKKHRKLVTALRIYDPEEWRYGRRRGINPADFILKKQIPDKKPEDWTNSFTIYTPPIEGASSVESGLHEGLVRRVTYGYGRVFFLSWDISRPPGQGVRGELLRIFQILCASGSSRGAAASAGDFVRHRENICTLLDSPAARLPHLALIGVLVILYIVIVGPVNYALLRRMGKRIFIPVTIPLIVIFYCLVITGAGYVTKGLTSLQRKVTVVNLVDGVDPPYAEMSTYFSIFSSGETSFSPALVPDAVGYRIFKHSKDVYATPVHMEQDVSGWRYRDVRLINWSSGYFTAAAVRDTGHVRDSDTKTGRITQTARKDGGIWIFNGTNFAFSGAIARVEIDGVYRYVIVRQEIPEYSGVIVSKNTEYESVRTEAVKKYFAEWDDKFEVDVIAAFGQNAPGMLDSGDRDFCGFLEKDPMATRTDGISEEKNFFFLTSDLPRRDDD